MADPGRNGSGITPAECADSSALQDTSDSTKCGSRQSSDTPPGSCRGTAGVISLNRSNAAKSEQVDVVLRRGAAGSGGAVAVLLGPTLSVSRRHQRHSSLPGFRVQKVEQKPAGFPM